MPPSNPLFYLNFPWIFSLHFPYLFYLNFPYTPPGTPTPYRPPQQLCQRIAIKGGGCSGFQYEFTFDKKLEADDLMYENILIDKTSADLLKGSEVDFVSELIGDQFKISNPQSKSSCGCGVSFSI